MGFTSLLPPPGCRQSKKRPPAHQFRPSPPLTAPHDRSVALTCSAGCLVEAYDTDSCGQTQLFYDLAGVCRKRVPLCAYIYTGRRYDPETALTGEDPRPGLYYYRARYYHPTLGRFTARDPKGYTEGMGLYQYTGGNPVIYLDPTGEVIFFVPMLVGAAVGAAIDVGVQYARYGHIESYGDILISAAAGASGGYFASKIAVGIGKEVIRGTLKAGWQQAAKKAGLNAAAGAGVGAISQILRNFLHGRSWKENIVESAAWSGAAGVAGSVAEDTMKAIPELIRRRPSNPMMTEMIEIQQQKILKETGYVYREDTSWIVSAAETAGTLVSNAPAPSEENTPVGYSLYWITPLRYWVSILDAENKVIAEQGYWFWQNEPETTGLERKSFIQIRD